MAIGLLLDMAAEGYRDRIALGSHSGGITYSDLQRAAAGGARRIAGYEPATVVFVGVNSEALPAALFASSHAGVPFASLNYRLPADQLSGLIDRLPEPLVVADAVYRDLIGTGRPVVASEDWLSTALETPSAAEQSAAGEDPAVMLFTSGTTSSPKCVVLSHHNLTSYVLESVDFGSADPGDAALISVPPYHIAGIGAILSNVYAGRRLAYLENFGPRAWLELVDTERITHAMVVPTMLARVVHELAGRPARAPALRHLAYGGARMPRPVLEAALHAFPGAGFVNSYGLTETSSTIAVLGPHEHRRFAAAADAETAGRLASAGRLLPGVEGEIRDEAGTPVPVGEVGELWVRGSQVSGRYTDQGSVLDEHGWFPTRDRARFDGEGYLFVLGRADDTIIRGGENIAPAEIEEVLVGHPDVKEVAVIGIPDDEWGELVCAAVVRTIDPRRSMPDAAALQTWTRSRLRGSRTPDTIVFVDALPYTATGKLARRQLRSDLLATRPAVSAAAPPTP
jgi:acyl-CoA synthetase (AMP-forming)/AMP-acid ligase II